MQMAINFRSILIKLSTTFFIYNRKKKGGLSIMLNNNTNLIYAYKKKTLDKIVYVD